MVRFGGGARGTMGSVAPEPVVEQMIAWCHRGPRMAHIRSVDIVPEQPTDAIDFTISF